MNQPTDVLCAGIIVADHVSAPISHLPAAGELVLADQLLLAIGGCAANVAVDLTKMGVAAGVVSGAAALLLQSRPTWSPDRVKFAFTSTAHNVASTNPNDVGSGEIDVNAARNAPTGLANQGVPESNGTGSLDLSRGDVQFQTNDPLGTIVTGSQTAQLLVFSQAIYVLGPWNELTWWGGQWTGGQWYGGQWTGGQWTGGQWTGGQWTGSGWTTGGQWYGSYE